MNLGFAVRLGMVGSGEWVPDPEGVDAGGPYRSNYEQ